ncbi:sensor histidine kinase [Paeniroseomonas aquatica]|uniref:histidine kinase n=1 Tax=Paeniroseomonas aquatica TaxID=373043 RepID=A0ABT8A3P0_9PROT|nr:sensor histidine kinase [Paeniroseomonas aquatica]MDN3564164.1 sensor histidine kinase [Paeniroseomonas aquatica]
MGKLAAFRPTRENLASDLAGLSSSSRQVAGSEVSIPSNDVGSGNSEQPEADRLTALARLLFATPHVLAWLSEDTSALPPGPDGDATSTRLWSFTSPGITIGTLHLAFATTRPSITSDQDQQRVKALADVATSLVEAQRDRRQAKKMIAEKELLAREADHRVANGLQLLHSALMLQGKLEDHTATRAALQTAARRVGAVARAHRHLHRAPSEGLRGGTSNAAAYLGTLLNDISQQDEDSYSAPSRSVALQVDPGAADALPTSLLPRLGLIAAELVANALKHGAGPITVAVRHAASAGAVLVSVSDLGPGFPDDFVPKAKNGKGLGMRLIAALSGPDSVWIDPANRRRIVVQLGG